MIKKKLGTTGSEMGSRLSSSSQLNYNNMAPESMMRDSVPFQQNGPQSMRTSNYSPGSPNIFDKPPTLKQSIFVEPKTASPNQNNESKLYEAKPIQFKKPSEPNPYSYTEDDQRPKPQAPSQEPQNKTLPQADDSRLSEKLESPFAKFDKALTKVNNDQSDIKTFKDLNNQLSNKPEKLTLKSQPQGSEFQKKAAPATSEAGQDSPPKSLAKENELLKAKLAALLSENGSKP